MERAKGIEPSYSAWKGIAKPNDFKSGSEKYAAKMGRNSHSFRTRATATTRHDIHVKLRGWRATQDKTANTYVIEIAI